MDLYLAGLRAPPHPPRPLRACPSAPAPRKGFAFRFQALIQIYPTKRDQTTPSHPATNPDPDPDKPTPQTQSSSAQPANTQLFCSSSSDTPFVMSHNKDSVYFATIVSPNRIKGSVSLHHLLNPLDRYHHNPDQCLQPFPAPVGRNP